MLKTGTMSGRWAVAKNMLRSPAGILLILLVQRCACAGKFSTPPDFHSHRPLFHVFLLSLFRLLYLVVKVPSSTADRLVGLVVRRPPRERKIPGSNPACAGIFFLGPVIPVTSKLALQWLPCQAPGVIGLALGLVGPVSIYCDWVRWKV